MNSSLSWLDLQVLKSVIDGGSLSAAARQLGLSQPTVRARIDSLEAALGTVLFTRSAAGMVPTEETRALAVHADAMALASAALVRAASGAPDKVSGTVRITVSEFVAAHVLPPMIVRLRRAHPGLTIEIAPSDGSANLVAQEADIAVRMYPPREGDLIARHVGAIRLGFFAHKDYARARGLPLTVQEMRDHDLIGPDRTPYDLKVAEKFGGDALPPRFAIRTDSHAAQFAAIRAGGGIGVVQRPIGRADPDLVAVLPEVTVAALETWIVVQDDMRRLPKVRTVFDHLVAEFTQYVALDHR
jgi:DNA-binding transcriptional LysR family regulator